MKEQKEQPTEKKKAEKQIDYNVVKNIFGEMYKDVVKLCTMLDGHDTLFKLQFVAGSYLLVIPKDVDIQEFCNKIIEIKKIKYDKERLGKYEEILDQQTAVLKDSNLGASVLTNAGYVAFVSAISTLSNMLINKNEKYAMALGLLSILCDVSVYDKAIPNMVAVHMYHTLYNEMINPSEDIAAFCKKVHDMLTGAQVLKTKEED